MSYIQGILPLVCLDFFTKKYRDRAKNLIINNSENPSNAFPIVQAAKEITSLISNELSVLDSNAILSGATVQGNVSFQSMNSLGNSSNANRFTFY